MVNAREVDGRFSLNSGLFEFVLIFGIRYSNFILAAAETKRPNKFASPTNGGDAALWRRCPRNDGLGSRPSQFDGWEAVTP